MSPSAPGSRALRHRVRVTTLAFLAVAAASVVPASPAAAHTQLDASEPADASTAEAPVEEIVLTFSLPVTPLGDAVVVDGPDGEVAVEVRQSDDGTLVIATPSAPLGGGAYAVAWTVAAQDGHPLDGSFGFAVESAEPSPAGTMPGSPSPEASATASASPGASPTSAPTPATSMGASDPEAAGGVEGDLVARVLARAGAAVALWALLVGAGALAFTALVLRGRDAVDAPRVLAGVRWCGALLLGGLALRVLGRSALLAGGSVTAGLEAEALRTALSGSIGWVIGLQALGGVLMLTGAWRSVGGSALAIAGVLAAGAGHVLGGHSNTVEPRWLVLVADVAHLVAAAVWVGGVLALVAVLRRRRRLGRPLDAAGVAARFSVVAAAAFVVVGVAGVVLAVAILDAPDELWTSTWGVVLLIKVALVAVVAVLGGYTHFRVVPRLSHRFAGAGAPDRAEVGHLARVTTAESVLFGAVVIATAVLVASAVHG